MPSKIDEAMEIIVALGFPRGQQNERSALSLLALVQLREDGSWQKFSNPKLGIRAILDFCRNDYGKPYAENSRESFRKETMHQFVAGGLALQNPDEPGRAPNSPKWCYQIAPDVKIMLESYGTAVWDNAIATYLAKSVTLAEKYKWEREMNRVPCILPSGETLRLSPGSHSELIRDVIEQFAPRFVPGARLVYVGDTGNKGVVFDEDHLARLGVVIHERGKMPDVVMHDEKRDWLILVESVTSVGPVDGKRHAELLHIFATSRAGPIFVTAFPNRSLMARFLTDIAWETEVWVADNPSHLIHFNGKRFLGPYGK